MMWTRAYLKTRAKNVLRTSYWKAFVVSLVIAIVGGGRSVPSFNWNFNNRRPNHPAAPWIRPDGDWLPSVVFILAIAAIFVIVMLVVLAFRIFLGYALEVGGKRYFSRAAQNDVNMNHLGYAFDGARYLDIIKAMLWKGVFNFLWYLLLIIPGIVKYYAYSMVPYILGDNPNIGYKRALELSKRMTYGEKFNMWVLDLSFIGWYLLGILALFVGVLFVMPYDNATKAELYLVLRQNALDRGWVGHEELKLDQPASGEGLAPV